MPLPEPPEVNSSAAARRAADPFLSRPAAAEYLGVATGTLEVWASTGRYNLPYFRIGRVVRYRLSDLDSWLERRVVTHASEVAA